MGREVVDNDVFCRNRLRFSDADIVVLELVGSLLTVDDGLEVGVTVDFIDELLVDDLIGVALLRNVLTVDTGFGSTLFACRVELMLERRFVEDELDVVED